MIDIYLDSQSESIYRVNEFAERREIQIGSRKETLKTIFLTSIVLTEIFQFFDYDFSKPFIPLDIISLVLSNDKKLLLLQ